MADTVTSIVTTKAGSYRITHPVDATDDQIRAYTADYLKKVEPETNFPPAQIDRPKPESFVQGAEEGASRVAYNLARAAETGADALGVREPLQRFGEFINPGATHDSVNDAQAEFNARQDARDTQGSGLGKFVGEVAATAPVAALPGGLLTQGAATGALLTDARTPGGVAWDAAKGAAGAVVGDRVLRTAASVLAPNVSNDVRTLLANDIRPTTGEIAGSANPGEQAGAGGLFKKLEDISAKVPVAGAGVNNAQFRAIQDLNRAPLNRALRAIGEQVPRGVAVGHDLIRYTGDRLSGAYNEVLPQLNGQADQAFATRIRAITARADVPPGYEDRMQSVVNEALRAFRPRNEPVGGNTIITADQFDQLPATQYVFNGRRLRDASERLGDISSAYRRSDDPYLRIIGDAGQQIRDQLHALARRENPEQAARLRDIDRGYASLVRAERAAQGTADGVFTPRQYDSAVRTMDRSARRRQSARGLAPDQDLSGAASRVMANNAAQGGSKDVNSLVALGLLGTRALAGDPLAMGGVGAVVGGSAAYSQPGQAALRALMTRQAGPGADRVAALLRSIAPYSAPPAAALIEGQ